MIVALQVGLALIFPAVANWLAAHNKFAKVLGPVVLCYGAGILFGNLGLPLDNDIAIALSSAAVPLAIPLLLFSSEPRKWLKLARPLLISFGLACASAVAAAGIVGWLFRHRTDEWVAPSIDVSCEFHHLDPCDQWCLLQGTSPVARDGLIGSHQQVWNERGDLVASGISHLLCRRIG